jgi:NADPH:quinone reductase
VKAALYERTGKAAEVLRMEEVERPEPGAGQVRVRLSVSGVNPTDVKSRAGLTPRPIDGFQIPHLDGAGVIDAVGEGVGPERVGQRVWVWFASVGQRWGTAAQWTVLPGARAVPLPDGALFDLGACLGVPAMTAHYCLFADGTPLEGRPVLVAGGAGAVGHYAIELAKRAGARVATTVSGPEKAELAIRAGADLAINYRDADALDQVRAFAERFDRIVEVDLGANLDLDLAVAGPETTIVTYAAAAQDPTLPVRRCMTANVTLRFALLYGVPQSALARATQDIGAALADGALTELPLHRFPLEDVVAAHEAVEAGVTGKVVLDIP